MIRLILNRDEPGDTDPDARYKRAANFLRHWQSERILIPEHEDALYVYHQEFDWEGRHYVRQGFMARVRIEEFGKGKIYPHEQTLSGPKADRLALTKACKMNLSPVFGLYPDPTGETNALLADALIDATPLVATDHLGVVHRMWPVTNVAVINAVRARLRESPVFIADGHHRYETANTYRNWLKEQGQYRGESDPSNFVLMMLVGMSDPGLAILPTHRLVSGSPGSGLRANWPTRSRSHLAVESMGTGDEAAQKTWMRIERDGGQNVFGFGTASDGGWLFARVTDASPMATLAPDQSDAWRELGVSLLHKLVIDHLLETAVSAERAANSNTCTCSAKRPKLWPTNRVSWPASCRRPASNTSKSIASKFEKMPPKSTYFYPKLLSGLVFNPLT